MPNVKTLTLIRVLNSTICHVPKPVKEKKPTKKQIATEEKRRFKAAEKIVKSLCSALCSREWYGKCAMCNRDGANAHHFFGWKACSNLRFTLENLVWLCYGCHIGKVHQQGLTEPVREKIIERIGQDRFDWLYSEAFQRKDWTLDELLELQKDLQERLDEEQE